MIRMNNQTVLVEFTFQQKLPSQLLCFVHTCKAVKKNWKILYRIQLYEYASQGYILNMPERT